MYNTMLQACKCGLLHATPIDHGGVSILCALLANRRQGNPESNPVEFCERSSEVPGAIYFSVCLIETALTTAPDQPGRAGTQTWESRGLGWYACVPIPSFFQTVVQTLPNSTWESEVLPDNSLEKAALRPDPDPSFTPSPSPVRVLPSLSGQSSK
jgi:hypothetical protein